MAEKEFITYKGYPLVKSGNTIYYGNFYDEYIVEMVVNSEKEMGDTLVPAKITLTLFSTDETLSPAKRIITRQEKKSMSDAMEMAYTWLSRKLQAE